VTRTRVNVELHGQIKVTSNAVVMVIAVSHFIMRIYQSPVEPDIPQSSDPHPFLHLFRRRHHHLQYHCLQRQHYSPPFSTYPPHWKQNTHPEPEFPGLRLDPFLRFRSELLPAGAEEAGPRVEEAGAPAARRGLRPKHIACCCVVVL